MDSKADVVIYGGTPSGIACAVRCAREGREVVLVCHTRRLGGIMSSGLGVTDNVYAGFRAPIYDTFVRQVREYYRSKYGEESKPYKACYVKGKLHVEPHVAERVFTDLVQAESRISTLYRYYPVSVERSGRLLSAVTLRSLDDSTTVRIEADAFVDASYEGDLAAAAGAEMRTGREGRNEYGEPHAGKLFVFPGNGPISPDVVAGLLDLRTITKSGQRIFADPTGEGDDAFQAYNYRVCLTCNPDNRIYPDRPQTYDRSLYLGIVKKPEEHDGSTFALRSHLMLSDGSWSFQSHLPNEKLTWNDPLLLDANLEYPAANWDRREQIVRKHKEFALGMLYFLQNDEAVRPGVRQEALRWGLPKDEFADNGHFPYDILVREGRRLVGRYVFTEHDALQAIGIQRAPIHSDSVGIADWPLSCHDCTSGRRPGSLNDGVLNLPDVTKPSQIPYRALLPKDSDNLLVTVCLSCSHMGWGTLRLEPVFMHLGESAAFAVSLAAAMGKAPGTLDANRLVRKLADNRVMVSLFQDIDLSAGQEWGPSIQYFGTKGFFDSYEAAPEAYLGRHTARLWAEAFGSLAAGDSTHRETAEKLTIARSQRVAEPERVSGNEFFQMIKDELVKHGINGLRWPLELNPESAMTRGNACLLLYQWSSER
ncbi:FAD-dependent oxidoreductase [Paenibacillus ginsengarvi]|uniref:FAD-dependent oxidoreductase n=1 Tax=Paenibacillus ginsengarvi TaxID=400777 RepID=UPI0013151F0F|nr:FAD-dependent oxidoreductase [Paenibacillus ginsengarvi]